MEEGDSNHTTSVKIDKLENISDDKDSSEKSDLEVRNLRPTEDEQNLLSAEEANATDGFVLPSEIEKTKFIIIKPNQEEDWDSELSSCCSSTDLGFASVKPVQFIQFRDDLSHDENDDDDTFMKCQLPLIRSKSESFLANYSTPKPANDPSSGGDDFVYDFDMARYGPNDQGDDYQDAHTGIGYGCQDFGNLMRGSSTISLPVQIDKNASHKRNGKLQRYSHTCSLPDTTYYFNPEF